MRNGFIQIRLLRSFYLIVRESLETVFRVVFARGVVKVTSGRLDFYAATPHFLDIATIFASDLYQLDSSVLSQGSQRVAVFIGAHTYFYKYTLRILVLMTSHKFRIAIQTEHFADENGTELWLGRFRDEVYEWLSHFDAILDEGTSSKASSSEMGCLTFHRGKPYLLGPFIFPDKIVKRSGHSQEKKRRFVYFGAVNERRFKILTSIKRFNQVDIITGYGMELFRRIQKSDGVINLHYQDGVYSESHRFLLAYVHHKLLFSERLSLPFITSVHYLPIEAMSLSTINHDEIMSRIEIDIAKKYKLSFALALLTSSP